MKTENILMCPSVKVHIHMRFRSNRCDFNRKFTIFSIAIASGIDKYLHFFACVKQCLHYDENRTKLRVFNAKIIFFNLKCTSLERFSP
jgi:hypothetical protein